MMRLASAMVTMPVPMLMSQDLLYSPIRQPASAVMALERHRPMVIIRAGLMEEDFTMSGLLPVARMDRPRRVLRNSSSSTTTTATKASATMSLRTLYSGVLSSRFCSMVNTVVVSFRLRVDLPMTRILMVYRPVFTMMPASRLSTPSFVCKMAVMKPERMPAPMAAKMARMGWPLMATTAPTAQPSVKHPSVDRSHTLSME